jgi:DNA-binding Lrp family transcriptional regulator
MPRRLVEFPPAEVIRLDLPRQLFYETRRAEAPNELANALDTNEVDHALYSPGGGSVRDETALERAWCCEAGLKSSQKTVHKWYRNVQSARRIWRFAIIGVFIGGAPAVDEIDRQLISILRNDARTSVASLAKALRVSRGTVQNRMARLEADGTIASYTIRLKPAVEEHRIRALMTVAVEGNRVDAVIKALRGDPAVTTLHSTNGRWDIVVELRADSLEAFDRVLARIRLVEGISQSETSLLLSTFK